jgi:hypothetical protein
MFWDIRSVILVNWLYQGASFNGAYFTEKILQLMAAEAQREKKAKYRSWRLIDMDNAKSHMSN